MTHLLDLSGPPGRSLFDDIPDWPARGDAVAFFDERFGLLIKNVRGIQDDRLLVLVGQLLVENCLDEFLTCFLGGYSATRDKRDFTLSLRIAVAKGVRFMPCRILNDVDFIRKLRNSFVHDISLAALGDIGDARLRSLDDRLRHYDLHAGTSVADSFASLVLAAGTGLVAYTYLAREFDAFVHSPGFKDHLHAHAAKRGA
jgi:hypothetical protein